MDKSVIVKEKDRNTGIVAAIVFAVVLFILLIFLSVKEPDPPLQDMPVPIELDEEMIIEDFEAFAGGGNPSDTKDPNPTPPDQGDPVVSTETSTFTHNTGQNGTKPVKDPKPAQQADESLTFPGTGGTGGGTGTGNLFGDGTDNNPGPGPGGDGTGNRKVVSDPCKPEFANESGTIYLTLWIDESGKVIKADNISSKSTSSSVSTIESAKKAVLKCMKYEPKAGAPVFKKEISIKVLKN